MCLCRIVVLRALWGGLRSWYDGPASWVGSMGEIMVLGCGDRWSVSLGGRCLVARSRWWLDEAVVARAMWGELERARLVTRLAFRCRGRLLITIEYNSDTLGMASNRLH